MNPIYLTEKHLESLMTGQIVSIEGPLNFSTKIVPPEATKDTCHMSYSLHRAIVDRIEKELETTRSSARDAWERADATAQRAEELETALAQLRLNTAYNA